MVFSVPQRWIAQHWVGWRDWWARRTDKPKCEDCRERISNLLFHILSKYFPSCHSRLRLLFCVTKAIVELKNERLFAGTLIKKGDVDQLQQQVKQLMNVFWQNLSARCMLSLVSWVEVTFSFGGLKSLIK